jgi:hypothetical protein
MGVSFDNIDSVFYCSYTTAGFGDPSLQPEFQMRDTNNYFLDSFAFPMKYRRTQNTVDTLVIQLVKVDKKYPSLNPPGLFALQLTSTTGRYLTAWYDSVTNRLSSDIPATAITNYKIPLNAAFYADTTINGYSRRTTGGFSLNHMPVPANNKIIAWVTFKSGINYLPGTPVTNANYILLYSYDLPGLGAPPLQNGNSFYSGLIATRKNKYEEQGDYLNQGHSILIPSIYYPQERYLMDMAFKIDCPICWPEYPTPINCPTSSVNEQHLQKGVLYYPNPAEDEMNIDLPSANKLKPIFVSVYDCFGKVVRLPPVPGNKKNSIKIITKDLVNGVYYFNICINGINQSGRFVIKH